jgi:uncharacterized protein
MTTHTPPATVRRTVAAHPLVSFFVLACGLSWLAWIPYVLSQHGLGVWSIPFPQFLGTAQFTGVLPGALLGPLGSAFLVTALADGRPGLRRWAHRLWHWKVAGRWYALALVGVPAIIVASGLPFSDGVVQAPGLAVLLSLVPGLVLQVFTTGLAEEPGWRDFALPRLQDRLGPLGAVAVLGPVWAGWHLPLFLSDWGGWPDAPWTQVLWFCGFCVSFNVIVCWVFNRTGQSLPLVTLLHCGVNNTSSMLWSSVYPTIPADRMVLGLFIVSTVAAALVLVLTRGRLGLPATVEFVHSARVHR